MELKIYETYDKAPSICLNMIVKNESHIIRETLEMLCDKIKFSYWVICDTGSTDNTKEIICNFFKEKQIEGEIIDHEWKNFAYNRTLALEMAFHKSDLLFIFDADDEIHGKIDMPLTIDDTDGYYLNFGSSQGISYQRVLLINNRIKWNFQSVIHEYINCLKPNPKIVTLNGDYYVISGRRGSRNQDPNKYLKDAKVLEEAYHKAKSDDDSLYLRYGFYCANSYKDAGMCVESIEWYKVTLGNNNWYQEKYVSCLYLFSQYKQINEIEKALFYLVESFKYDTERMECVFHLVVHYLLSGLPLLAYHYYSLVKDFYENRYLKNDVGKLFVEVDKPNFFLPYYMILVSDKVKESIPEAKLTITKMYVIIFTKKFDCNNNEFFIGNLLYNLQFFIEQCITLDGFKELFQSYIDFLQNVVKYNLSKHDFLKVFIKYGIKFECFNINKISFTIDECKKSNKILFYTGFANLNWNYSLTLKNALGGSETAVISLARSFPKNMEIYIGGSVQEEKIENITFVNLNNIKNLVKTTPFHTVIVSRYIAFYEMFPETSFYKSFIWGHDVALYNYGCNLDVKSILNNWNSKITGCICQTEWHKHLFAEQYPQIKDKLTTINNGIDINKFNNKPIKISNRFIYTSCAERGLERLLELWPQIIENLPDAELFIASYNQFPQNDFERQLQTTINKFDNIKHMGTLNKDKLYQLMSTAEFWLYPTNFTETSCITSMEMLMSEVICIYYPIAGLVNTLGNYGIPIQRGNEIDTILNLSTKQKYELKKKGKEYAISCSWDNRANIWSDTLNLNNKTKIEISDKNIQRMFDLYKNISMPEAHTRVLKNISNQFTPKVIYDIGASTLHWTKEVKKIWNNIDIIAFDSIEEAEELYKSQNIKFHIGVLSDQDNKVVKFYENKENPAGNSYYKEIGHPNSINIYPENSYTEKIAMTLQSIVQQNNFLLPDIVKIDVQGAELDILKGGQNIINHAKYLIIELQNIEYNRGAPLENVTIEYLQNNGWKIEEAKFSNNGPDADYLFINTKYTKSDKLDKDYIIKIINLNRRSDRKKSMIQKLNEMGINNYDFFEAIDGNLLEPSVFIKNLFKNNDFNYRRGIVGCALSHYQLWQNLINDENYSYYIILEDDVEFVPKFNEYLDNCIDIIKQKDIKYCLIGGYQIQDKLTTNDTIQLDKIITPICSGTFGYIISKQGCRILVNHLNNSGINRAIDHSDLYTNCLDMYKINKYLVRAESLQIHGKNDTDIQFNYDCINFDSIPIYTVSFTDWWTDEYCGGTFNTHNNFFTDLLSDFYIKIVSPEDNPDILFYSVFGNNHLNLTAKRKIFYTGEAISQDNSADFNISFDNNSINNCRLPLWICYLNDTIINDYNNKIQQKIEVPKKSKFCSIICQQDNVSNTRSEIVNKLSEYKRVDCGGKFLNNIGYIVPKGINCSGKIEHNRNYKFVIAFENKNYPGYVTEKICDVYKSNSIPIYWGTHEIVKDFNPRTFINANDFVSIDELVNYIIKVDNDDELYASYFKEPILTPTWHNILTDPNNTFFKNLTDNIIGQNTNNISNKPNIKIFNIWHHKLFSNCYSLLDDYSLKKIDMYAVNEKYKKIYDTELNFNIIREYELPYYDNIFQDTNFCQTSCFYHVYKNNLHSNIDYIGFIQYDMELDVDFIYDIENNFKENPNSICYSLLYTFDCENLHNILVNKIIEQYNLFFKTRHTYKSLFNDSSENKIILLHTFVIPTKMYSKLMSWYCYIKDWIYVNCINKTLSPISNAEITEILFGIFLLIQMNEDSSITLHKLKLNHNWPNLHQETSFNNYKDSLCHFNLASIANDKITDKNTVHSYLDLYEKILVDRQFDTKNVLEIGIYRGGSIKMWNDYFVNANIYGLDIDIDAATTFLKDYPRITIQQRDAYSLDTIQSFIDNNITFDVILDDGPHTIDSMIFTLLHYSKLLSPKGILIIEDIPSLEWTHLFEKITYKYKSNTNIYDLRENKGRFDDIVFTFTNNSFENLNFIDYKINYGVEGNTIDITHKVIAYSLNKPHAEIPPNDTLRAELYGDSCWGIVKSIYITEKNGAVTIFPDNKSIKIDINNGLITKSIDPNYLTVYESPFDKIRLGKDFDGGYIICNIPNINYDFFLSGEYLMTFHLKKIFVQNIQMLSA